MYYKAPDNSLHFLDFQEFENLLPAGSVRITDSEAAAARAPSLAQAQSAQVALVTSAYQVAISASVSFTTSGKVTKTFQADAQSRQNLSDMIAACAGAGATPAGFYWVAADNTQVPFTYADLQGLAAAIGTQGWAAFQRLQAAKAAIAAATSVTAAQAVAF